jgi:hypothetical protein
MKTSTVMAMGMALIGESAWAAEPLIFRTPDGLVSLQLPSTPDRQSTKSDSTANALHTSASISFKQPDLLLVVRVTEISGPVFTGEEDEFLAKLVASLTAQFGSQLVLDPKQGNSDLRLGPNGLIGKQVIGTLDGAVNVTWRIFMGACRSYTI